MDYTWTPKRGSFFRPEVYKRVKIQKQKYRKGYRGKFLLRSRGIVQLHHYLCKWNTSSNEFDCSKHNRSSNCLFGSDETTWRYDVTRNIPLWASAVVVLSRRLSFCYFTQQICQMSIGMKLRRLGPSQERMNYWRNKSSRCTMNSKQNHLETKVYLTVSFEQWCEQVYRKKWGMN